MAYLPTFTIKINQMWINILVPWILWDSFLFFPSQRLNACKARNPLFETSKELFSSLEMCIMHIPKNLMLGHNLLEVF